MAELGAALVLTEDDIERLAEITTDDIQAVQLAWQAEVPRWAQNLLLADNPTGENQNA